MAHSGAPRHIPAQVWLRFREFNMRASRRRKIAQSAVGSFSLFRVAMNRQFGNLD